MPHAATDTDAPRRAARAGSPDAADAPVVPIRDADYATEHYDDDYYNWILRNRQFRSHRLRLAWVGKLVDPRPGDRIVDLGCGCGLVDEFLAQQGASVHGVDLSAKAVAVARELNRDRENVTYEVGDASDLPHLPDGSFDKAISADVTEHCGYETMLAIFREAHRLLRPGGTYFIYTPNPRHWIERLKTWGILKQDPTHTGLRVTESIAGALREAGFEIAANPPTASMLPGMNALEWLWRHQPLWPQLGVYRVVLLARKPEH